jgi:DNA topoisomerase-3
MKLCIAEKPSVASEIAKVLGASQRHDGYFEGNGYRVTYTFGHLCSLLEPHDYKAHWKSWNLNNLPMLPDKFGVKVVSNRGIEKQFGIIRKLLAEAQEVINCGDAGQEGELIQRWVLDQGGYRGVIKRLWISSLTTEAIREGFDRLKPSTDFDNLYHAGYSRAIGDWILGMNATRLYTLSYGKPRQVLSIGRVQTPTLAMIVERYLSIMNFEPQPYWVLQTSYCDTVFQCEEGRFTKKEEGQALFDRVEKSDFEIISAEKKKGLEYAPKLFDLTGLQVYCNKKFGYTAEETLKIAQSLYEQKLITYPRVDTTYLPGDVYPKVPGILANLTRYKGETELLLGKKIRKSRRVFQDKKVTDHHAIIPTGVEKALPERESRVYDIIVRRFLAIFYPDCQVAHTVVNGQAAGIPFRTSGKQILKTGWRTLFQTEDKAPDGGQPVLPDFTPGESGPHEPSFLEKATKPPRHFTEASLLRAMETAGKQIDDEEMRELLKANGIGRPSTRANIIETLFKRNYIERNKKQILPTETGIQLIRLIDNQLLKSPELTGIWEKRLREIEEGTYSPANFVSNMKRMVDQLVYEVRSGRRTNRNEIVGSPCPLCAQGKIIKGRTAYGCDRYREGCDYRLPFV